MYTEENPRFPNTQEGRQEFFDLTIAYLRKQGEKSAAVFSCNDHKEACVYVSETTNGQMNFCAIGMHIPEEMREVIKSVEKEEPIGDARALLSGYHQSLAPYIPFEDIDFLLDLQHLHDGFDPEERQDPSDGETDWGWESQVRQLAQNHNLTYTPPETLNG